MKKIYKCNLNTVKESDFGLIFDRNGLVFSSNYACLNPYLYEYNFYQKLYNKYKNFLLRNNIDIKDLSASELENLFYEFKLNNKNIKTVKLIPKSLYYGNIYVTKTLIPNIVKELNTGYYFYVIDEDTKISSNKVCVVRRKDLHVVNTIKDYKLLNNYLQNQNVVKYFLDLASKYSENLYKNYINYGLNKELINKVKKEENKCNKYKETKKINDLKNETKRLLKIR